MELMNGFPPSPDQLVTLSNWRKPPFNRWAFNHVSELVPSAPIRTHPVPDESAALQPAESGLDDLSEFELKYDGNVLGMTDWLDQTYTDSLVILKNGRLVFEYYGPGQDAVTPHIWMSVSKSVLGLMAGIVAGRGQLDVDAAVTDIIPEMKNSVYKGATVRDVLDMRVGIMFDEDYHASSGPIIEYRKAHLWDPLPVGEEATDLRRFLTTLTESDGPHNGRFHYVSPNTDLLGWVIERASGMRFHELVSEALWQPLQAERDGYITVDRFGAPRCAGGLCTGPRDMARLGRLFATAGRVGDRQVVPAAWIDDIIHAGDPAAWKKGDFYDLFGQVDMHYRNQWYIERGERPLVYGMGVFGQHVFADPFSDLVVAKCSSQPLPLDGRFLLLTHAGVRHLCTLYR